LETVFRDYAPKGVQFYYVYKALAHWGLEGYVGPVTIEERLIHIQEAKRTLGTEITWLADTMANDLKHLIGDASNSEFILGPDGKIIHARLWSDPEQLREDLGRLVGVVENPTTVADLGLVVEPPPEPAPRGILERVRLEGDFNPLIALPQLESTNVPFYAKLRVAAQNRLLLEGEGQLYLGYFLDPVYNVHWNNEAAPVQYEIVAPEAITVTPAKGQGPTLEHAMDSDPREFVLNVNRNTSTEPMTIKFFYYACNDAWCVPVRQEYLITWDLDRDSGTQFGLGEIDPRMLENYPQ